MTAHAQAQYLKGSSHQKTLPQSDAILRYSGYRACRVCALQSSSCACNGHACVDCNILAESSFAKLVSLDIYTIQYAQVNPLTQQKIYKKFLVNGKCALIKNSD